MPLDGLPAGVAIHATAVAIGDRALLIQGPSRSGKSRLAAALISRSTQARPIELIGDDRILLEADSLGVTARPHPRIVGFIERRGLGLCAVRYRESARVAGVVRLETAHVTHPILIQFPAFTVTRNTTDLAGCDGVLIWFEALLGQTDSAARGPQVDAKASDAATPLAKD